MELQLTNKEFKALASPTRTKILKALKERNYTATELATKLNLSTPTIKEHLNILEKTELIKAIDEGRKWKYYKLTEKAITMLEKKEQQNKILIILSITTMLGLLTLSFIFINTETQTTKKTQTTDQKDFTIMQKTTQETIETKCMADKNYYKTLEEQEKANQECNKLTTPETCKKNEQTKCEWKE
ncbi:MAG: winged helix-turn-helix domain-containing protein [Candidatus Diapherotrites archaeon]